MSVAMVRDLYDYHRWANHKLFDFAAALGEDLCGRDAGAQFSVPPHGIPGQGFPQVGPDAGPMGANTNNPRVSQPTRNYDFDSLTDFLSWRPSGSPFQKTMSKRARSKWYRMRSRSVPTVACRMIRFTRQDVLELSACLFELEH